MSHREDELRERFDREHDILRGLGGMPSLADLRAESEALSWAAVEDGGWMMMPEPDPEEMAFYREMNEAMWAAHLPDTTLVLSGVSGAWEPYGENEDDENTVCPMGEEFLRGEFAAILEVMTT